MTVDVELALLEATATYLDAQGVGTYLPGGGYQSSDTAIVFGPVPTAPDRGIGLTVYGSNDYVKQTISEYRMQLWCRGNAGSTIDAGTLAGSIFQTLQGLEDRPWGDDLYLIQCYRVSFVPQGIDDNQRQERADNYVFRVNTPTSVGRPV